MSASFIAAMETRAEDVRMHPMTFESYYDDEDPRLNSWEAFADWFDEYVESLEDIEEDGRDFMEVMMEWCEANNHECLEIGVLNHNIKWYKATKFSTKELYDGKPNPSKRKGSVYYLLFGPNCQACATDEDTDDEDEEEEEEVLEDLTCDQLRNRLRAMNKPVSGCKARLIKRIRDHEQLREALFKED